MKQIAIAVFAVLSASGCSSFAPIWPMTQPQTEFVGYPTVILPTPSSCDVATSAPGNLDGANKLLYCAQQHAVDTLKTFAREQRRIEAIRNGEVLSVFGLGTAAGVKLAEQSTTAPIRTLGLAAVTLTGLDAVLGVSGQHDVYGAGVTAVSCLIRTDAALEDAAALHIPAQMADLGNQSARIANLFASNQLMQNAQAPLNAGSSSYTAGEINLLFRVQGAAGIESPAAAAASPPTGAGSPPAGIALQGAAPFAANGAGANVQPHRPSDSGEQHLRSRVTTARSRLLDEVMGLQLPTADRNQNALALRKQQIAPKAQPVLPGGESSAPAAAEAAARLQASDAVAAIGAAKDANVALTKALIDDINPLKRARALMDALNQIDKSLGDSLFKGTDPSKVFDTIKTGLGKVAGASSAKAQAIQQTSATAAIQASNFLDLKIGDQGCQTGANTSDACIAKQSVDNAKANATTTKNFTDQYAACVSAQSPKVGSQNPGSSDGSGDNAPPGS